ncbi:MAG TPA: ABC transporter substrate-binding protein [Terriglobales bacterium]|jgi:MarR-like DNA-binding transcriptional regulator SgrR of sgrS sRNA|nr:ABC transporter substrate-binding protein [Terriglobales bacterium]
MKRFSLLWLAGSSLLWAGVALAAIRPHYGGTLRLTMRQTPQALDPISLVQADASNLARLIYDTLIVLDHRGQPEPSLAVGWQAESGNQRWRISLRNGVSFSDGTKMDANTVAASLRAANPDWRVLAGTDTVIVQTAEPHPYLLAELALPRNSIVHGGLQPSGTGPFSLAQWTPGKHLSLSATEQYWKGRPFLDSIELDFGMGDREQSASFDLGRTDVAEIAPENIRRARAEGRAVVTSSPSELLALVFSAAPQSDEEAHLRNALALSLDIPAINNVVLQGGGEPTGALLPNWLSGYGFVFPFQASSERARQECALAKQRAPLLLAYDASDPVAHTIAERILLNARDAGVTLQLTTHGPAGVTLARIPLASMDPQTSLTELTRTLKIPTPAFTGNSAPEIYSTERELLRSRRMIPLIHLRTAIMLGPNVRQVALFPDGSLYLNDAWLEVQKP